MISNDNGDQNYHFKNMGVSKKNSVSSDLIQLFFTLKLFKASLPCLYLILLNNHSKNTGVSKKSSILRSKSTLFTLKLFKASSPRLYLI